MSVVGIDLGTTNTVVSCVRGGRVHVLADEHGRRLLPSVVSFHPNGEVLVGHAAKERRVVDAKNTIFSVKRLIGRSFRTDEVQRANERFAFDLREGPGQAPIIVARDKEYTLPEISALVLRRARQIAEVALGEPVERAVITVPANFNELQRAATKVAGRIAGLEVLRILNEPTAAALAYGLGKSEKERVAIYDFGGGTFDCTLLDLSGNVFEVLATAGDSFLGGDDIDNAIAERMAEAFLIKHRYDPRADTQAFERLRVAAEQVKVDLSTGLQATARLREVAFGLGGAHLDLNFGLSRHELETIIEPLVARSLHVTEDALSLAGLQASSFGKVILVGGSTRIPLVANRVEGLFSQKPMDHLNPDEVVAIGAAIQAAALTDAARRRSIPSAPTPAGIPSNRRVSTVPGVMRERMPSIPADDALTDVGDRTYSRSASSRPPTLDVRPVPTTTARMPSVPSITARSLVAPPASAYDEPPFPPTQPVRQTPPAPRPKLPTLEPLDAESSSIPTATDINAFKRAAESTEVEETPDPTHVWTSPLASTSVVPLAQPLFSPPATPPVFTTRVTPVPPPRQSTSPLATTGNIELQRIAPLAPPMIGRSTITSSTPPPLPQGQPGASGARESSTPPPAFQRPSARAFSSSPSPSQSPPPPAPVLIDVTPRALVVETVAGFCDTVIPRNARIPCDCTRVFATVSDMQSLVRVRVAQGEDEIFARNTFLGELELSGIRAAPRGEVTISVTFELDANGTLRVQAADVATGRETRAVLQLVGIAEEAAIAEMTRRHATMPVALRDGDGGIRPVNG